MMMRRLLLLVAVSWIWGTLSAATPVPLIRNGNIRYGPSLEALVILTLRPGETVTVLGPVEGKSGWYRVRFPEQGHAWIHSRAVGETDEEGVLRVVVDGTRVRSDATISGEAVVDLAVGDTVVSKNRRVGDWLAVAVPSATAFVYHSVLDAQALREALRALDPAVVAERAAAAQATEVQELWRELQEIYHEYHAVYARDRGEALTLDWQGLIEPLRQVVEHHPDLRSRLVAERMRSIVVRMLHAGIEPISPQRMGIAEARPHAERPETPSRPAQPGVSPADEPEQEPEQTPTQAPVTVEPEAPAHTQPESQPEPKPEPKPEPSVARMPEGTVVEGWIEPQEVPGLGTRYSVVGDRGVAAFIVIDPEAGIDLSQLYWRRVRVVGRPLPAEEGTPELFAGVPRLQLVDLRIVQ